MDKVPPPPGGGKKQEPSSVNPSRSLRNHPLLSAKSFGTLPISKLKAMASLNDADCSALIRSWSETDRALAKYALSYRGSSLKLNKAECKIVARFLAEHKNNPNSKHHAVQLHFASEVPGDLLTGFLD